MFLYAPSVKIKKKVTKWLLLCLYINVDALDLSAYSVVSSIPATQPHIKTMTRILEKHHLDDMLQSLRGAVRPGVLSFQIDDDTVQVSGAKSGKFVLRAIRKNSTHWIISHPEALFS